MKVELEMTIDEDNESDVMQKVDQITRLAKQLGFRFDEIEIERDKEDEDEDEAEESDEARKTTRHSNAEH